MTRVIGGSARGRRLAVPSDGTRPTSDRAREALFNTLRSHVHLPGAWVLDLFAGSGAVGLEALSRGAAGVVLVESDRAAADVVRRNIATVALHGATVVRRSVAAHLAGPPPGVPYALVFADPPYDLAENELAAVLGLLTRPGTLAPDAMVVVERSARGAEPGWPGGVTLVTERRYGEARLWYGRANHELSDGHP